MGIQRCAWSGNSGGGLAPGTPQRSPERPSGVRGSTRCAAIAGAKMSVLLAHWRGRTPRSSASKDMCFPRWKSRRRRETSCRAMGCTPSDHSRIFPWAWPSRVCLRAPPTVVFSAVYRRGAGESMPAASIATGGGGGRGGCARCTILQQRGECTCFRYLDRLV